MILPQNCIISGKMSFCPKITQFLENDILSQQSRDSKFLNKMTFLRKISFCARITRFLQNDILPQNRGDSIFQCKMTFCRKMSFCARIGNLIYMKYKEFHITSKQYSNKLEPPITSYFSLKKSFLLLWSIANNPLQTTYAETFPNIQ